MRILVTGAAGLVGTELKSFLTQQRHHVVRLVRGTRSAADEIRWDPVRGVLDAPELEGLEAVVHLAGENISTGRWTADKKRRIRESRVRGTRLLSESLARLFDPPKVLVSVSAVGYYGDRGDEPLDEDSDPGSGFLPDVCREWEDAAAPAVMRGIRVVHPRLGMVLSPRGGALARMLPPFRMGIGGRIGNGRQYVSWIALEDLVAVIDYAIHNASLSGPVNAVAPETVTNQEFSVALGRVLSRPAVLFLPEFAARLAYGEMADALLLASARVAPVRLRDSGFQFRFPELDGALRHALMPPGK